jgi:hypothetical protein
MLMADAVGDYAVGALGRCDLAVGRDRTHCRSALSENSYELNVTEAGRPTAARAFHHEHAGIYGYATPEREIEVVTIGVRTCQRLTEPKLTREPCRKALTEIRHVWVEEA